MDVLDQVFRPYLEGQPAVLLTNRSLFDLVVDGEGKMRPLLEALRRECYARHRLACVTYSLAAGIEWMSSQLDDERDRKTIERVLQEHNLLNIPQDQNEVPRVIRGFASLSRQTRSDLKWSTGDDMRFALVLLFSHHLTPGNLQNGTQTDAQLIAGELIHIMANSLALRASGNYIIFHGEDGLLDPLVCSALQRVDLRQPDTQEKKLFLSAAFNVYSNAKLEDSLTPDGIASLSANTPNRGLEIILRASHRGSRIVTAADVLAQKAKDVEQLSEGTLELLDTNCPKDSLQLVGRNIAVAAGVMSTLSGGLLGSNKNMPANVLLAGPPGTGKTELAKKTAREGHAAAYLMHSPKGPFVGSTERMARQQQTLLRQWTPNVALCDEITEQFPMERSDFDGDSGASRAVLGQLLTSLSDEGRRGKALLVATTNCPWRIGSAMRSRFTVIPVLHPLAEDYPQILLSIANQVFHGTKIDLHDERVQEASRIYYQRSANPRHIRASLSTGALLKGKLDAETILFAARDFCGTTDAISMMYADYWALRCCSSKSFLPWSDDPASYPFPKHLADVVDPQTGAINEAELTRRIEELRSHANL